MNRLTISGTALVLAATVLTGGTLVSVALAATIAADPEPVESAGAVPLSDGDLHLARDVATRAAAAALDLSTGDLSDRLAAGTSLKQIADAQGVGYGSVARVVNDAAAARLDEQLGGKRAEAAAGVVADWIDAGGQPDAELLGGHRDE